MPKATIESFEQDSSRGFVIIFVVDSNKERLTLECPQTVLAKALRVMNAPKLLESNITNVSFLTSRLYKTEVEYTEDTSYSNTKYKKRISSLILNLSTESIKNIDLADLAVPIPFPHDASRTLRLGYTNIHGPITGVSTSSVSPAPTVDLIRSSQKVIKKTHQRAASYNISFRSSGEQIQNELSQVIRQLSLFPITWGYGGPFGNKNETGFIPNHEVVVKSFTTTTVPGSPDLLETTLVVEPFVWDWYLSPEVGELGRLVDMEDLICWPLFKIWCEKSSPNAFSYEDGKDIFELFPSTEKDYNKFLASESAPRNIGERTIVYENLLDVIDGERSRVTRIKKITGIPKSFLIKLNSQLEWQDFFGEDNTKFPGYLGLIEWNKVKEWNFVNGDGEFSSETFSVPENFLANNISNVFPEEDNNTKSLGFLDVYSAAAVPTTSDFPWEKYAVVISLEDQKALTTLRAKISIHLESDRINTSNKDRALLYKEDKVVHRDHRGNIVPEKKYQEELKKNKDLQEDHKEPKEEEKKESRWEPAEPVISVKTVGGKNKDIIIDQIVCVKSHNAPTNYASTLDLPIHQFLGSSSTSIIVKGKCIGVDATRTLEEIQKEFYNQLREKDIKKNSYPDYCYRVKNGLINMYGVNFVIPMGLTKTSVEGHPDLFEFTLEFLEYQPLNSSQEALKPLETTWQNMKKTFDYHSNNGGEDDPLLYKAAEWFNVQANLSKENLYQDMKLPYKSEVYGWVDSLRRILENKPLVPRIDYDVQEYCKEFFNCESSRKGIKTLSEVNLKGLGENDLTFADPDFFIFYNSQQTWESILTKASTLSFGLPTEDKRAKLPDDADKDDYTTVFFDESAETYHILGPEASSVNGKIIGDYWTRMEEPGVGAFPKGKAEIVSQNYKTALKELDSHPERWWSLSPGFSSGDKEYFNLKASEDILNKPFSVDIISAQAIKELSKDDESFFYSLDWRRAMTLSAWASGTLDPTPEVQSNGNFCGPLYSGAENLSSNTRDLEGLKKLRSEINKAFGCNVSLFNVAIAAAKNQYLLNWKFSNPVPYRLVIRFIEDVTQNDSESNKKILSNGSEDDIIQKFDLFLNDTFRLGGTSFLGCTSVLGEIQTKNKDESINNGLFWFGDKFLLDDPAYWHRSNIDFNLACGFLSIRGLRENHDFDLPEGAEDKLGFGSLFQSYFSSYKDYYKLCPSLALGLTHISLTKSWARYREVDKVSMANKETLDKFLEAQENINKAYASKSYSEVVLIVRQLLNKYGLGDVITLYYQQYLKFTKLNGAHMHHAGVQDPFFTPFNPLIYLSASGTKEQTFIKTDHTPNGQKINVEETRNPESIQTSSTVIGDVDVNDLMVNGEIQTGIDTLASTLGKIRSAMSPTTEDSIYGCIQDLRKYGKFNRLVRAFPSYSILVINEGSYWMNGNKKLWDQFYTRGNAAKVEVFKSRLTPTWEATITFSDIFRRSISTSYLENILHENIIERRELLQNIVFNPGLAKDEAASTLKTLVDGFLLKNVPEDIANLWAEQMKKRLLLGPGSRIQIRMGYGSNAASLPVTFTGQVISAESTDGNYFQIVAQGDGAELEKQPAEASVSSSNSYTYTDGGYWGMGKSPANIITEALVGPNLLGAITHGFFRDWSKASTQHFGDVVYTGSGANPRTSTVDFQINIYNSSNTKLEQVISPVTNFMTRNALYNWDDVNYFSISVKEPTTWKIIETCRRACLDFVAAPETFGFRSSLFFGKWWWPYHYEYDDRVLSRFSETLSVKPLAPQVPEKIKNKGVGKIDWSIVNKPVKVPYPGNSNIKVDPSIFVPTGYGMSESTGVQASKQEAGVLPISRVENIAIHDLSDEEYVSFLKSKPYSQFHIAMSGVNLFQGRVKLEGRNIATDAIGIQTHNGWFSSESVTKTNVWSVDNNIEPSDRRTMMVEVGLVTTSLQAPLKGFTDKVLSWLPGPVGDIAQKPTTPAVQNSVIQSLCDTVKNMYDGWLIIDGYSSLKPRDFILYNDAETRLQGPLHVKEVIHSLDPESGFITYISPDLVVLPKSSVIGQELILHAYTGLTSIIGNQLAGLLPYAILKSKISNILRLASGADEISAKDFLILKESDPETYSRLMKEVRKNMSNPAVKDIVDEFDFLIKSKGLTESEFILREHELYSQILDEMHRNILNRVDSRTLRSLSKKNFSKETIEFWTRILGENKELIKEFNKGKLTPETIEKIYTSISSASKIKDVKGTLKLTPWTLRTRLAVTEIGKQVVKDSKSAYNIVKDSVRIKSIISGASEFKNTLKTIKMTKMALSSTPITLALNVTIQIIGNSVFDGINAAFSGMQCVKIIPLRKYKGVPYVAGIKGHQGSVLGEKPGLVNSILDEWFNKTLAGTALSVLTGLEYPSDDNPANQKMRDFLKNEEERFFALERKVQPGSDSSLGD